MMRENKKRKNAYATVLLCMYLLGSVCALALRPGLKGISSEDSEIVKLIPALLFLFECLIFSSMIGLVILPLSTLLAGASTTTLVFMVENKLLAGDKAYYLFAALAVLAPLSFMICSEGMEISWQLRQLMSSRRNGYKKKLFLSYSIMFIGMAFIVMLGRNILTI